MDLFGNERRRLRQELKDIREQKEKVSARAAERQDRIDELLRIIDDLRAAVHSCRARSASPAETSAAEQALRDAIAIHSESTR